MYLIRKQFYNITKIYKKISHSTASKVKIYRQAELRVQDSKNRITEHGREETMLPKEQSTSRRRYPVKDELSHNWPNNRESEHHGQSDCSVAERRGARWEVDVNTRCPPLLHLSTALRDFNYPWVEPDLVGKQRIEPLHDARASSRDTNVVFMPGYILCINSSHKDP